MKNRWAELFKHLFILGILLFSFFPMYMTFSISVKNNRQFNASPFGIPTFIKGWSQTFKWEPADENAYDPISINAALEAKDRGMEPTKEAIALGENAIKEGLRPDMTNWPKEAWPYARVSTPYTIHWENWSKAWGIVSGYIFNTIFVAVTAVTLALCFSLSTAFFFARYRVAGSSVLWYVFLILMLMPGVANLIPLFILLKDLSLLNSLWALVIIGVSGAQVMQIYILRNFIEDIPQDLFDSAEVDGASSLRQIISIVLPMSGSIISTLAILQFIAIWNDFILPFIIIRDDSLLTLSAGLVKLDGEYVKKWGEMMAGYSIAAIPLVIIFLFTMRLFVKGIAAGAVKG